MKRSKKKNKKGIIKTEPFCTKGYEAKCLLANGKKCNCNCTGENHGKGGRQINIYQFINNGQSATQRKK